MKKIWDWIVWSSEDPEKLSLTLKSGVPFVILFLGWAHWGSGVDAASANDFVSALVSVLVKVVELATLAGTVWGAARKIFNSLKSP